MSEQDRAEFEAWCRNHRHADAQGERVLDAETGREFYMDPAIDLGWDAWLAARRNTVPAAELEAIADKLPKTADGVPVVPGVDAVWIDNRDGTVGEYKILGLFTVNEPGSPECVPIEESYSTREAAEAAKEQPHD